jgi:hypothetical protein
MFLKPYHEITLKDVILLDATKSASVLKKYWFIPLFICRKELEKLAKDIFTSIGGETVTSLQDQFDKVMQYRKLQIYEALYKAVQIELSLKPKINAFKIIIEKDYKDSPQLERVLEEVKKWTGIQIETPEDLQSFTDWVQYKIDKYAEMFPAVEIETKQETPLIEVFYSVFSYMGEPFNDKMLLIAFLGMKKMAEGKIAKQSNNSENGELE